MIDLDLTYLEKLHNSTGMTHQQIADKSGIPVGTVSRIMSGQTRDPAFSTVAGITHALGGSLDEMTGIHHAKSKADPQSEYIVSVSREAYQNSYNSLLNHIKIKDRWICVMFAYCCFITVAAFVMEVIR